MKTKRKACGAVVPLMICVSIFTAGVSLSARGAQVNQYSGVFGGGSATFELQWQDDAQVFGGTRLSDGAMLQFSGSNYAEGRVRLGIFNQGKQIGTLDLAKQVAGKTINWSGVAVLNDGARYNVRFSRSGQISPISAPPPAMPLPAAPAPSVDQRILTFEEAKQRADQGDAFAQAVVALHYQLGWSTEKNPELAAKYAMASANAGEPLGQFRLGALLREGTGLPKNEQEGLNLQAASFNSLYAAQDPYSMTAAGVMIFQGKVIGQNISQEERRRDAAALYKKAADAGYAPAQFNYAMCAEMGHGIPRNLELRNTYLAHAARQNYQLASQGLGQGLMADGTASETQPLRSAASRKELRLDSRSVGIPQNVNSLGVSTVLQRPPRASIVRACGTDPNQNFFYAVEGNSLTAWELPTGRLLKSYPIPNSDAEQRWLLRAELNFDAAGRLILAELKEGARRSVVFDRASESFSDSAIKRGVEESDWGFEQIPLSCGGKVVIKLTESPEEELGIAGFSVFSRDGSLLNQQTEEWVENRIRSDFTDRLASVLGLPRELFREKELLFNSAPHEKSEMTFLRSWFKWNYKNLNALVELSCEPRISFVKNGDVSSTVEFPGHQLKPQRFIALDRSGTKLLSWILPEGYLDSAQPPSPCIVDVNKLTVKHIHLPKDYAALNGRFDDQGNVVFVVGRIRKKAPSDYLVIDTLKVGFSGETGVEQISQSTGEFSPYETGYDQGDLDPEEAVEQSREVALGSASTVEPNNAKNGIEKAKSKVFRKQLSDEGDEVLWRFSDGHPRDVMTMTIQTRNGDHLTSRFQKGERLFNAAKCSGLLLLATSKGVYSFDLDKVETVDFWSVPETTANVDAGYHCLEEYAAFDPIGHRVYIALPDGSIRVLEVSIEGSISEIATIQFTTKGEPILLQADNTYANLGRSTDGIHFSDGHRTYPFEQFDLRLNRPDIVLERLGAPAEAVGIAKQLREKRLKRMGVTEEMLKPDFHVPELDIVGDVPAATDADAISLSIKASDSKYPLERLKVFVNNVPVNGRDGESLHDQDTQSLERTIPIKLAAGRNKIQVSVLNNAGAESLYANAEINCTAKRPKPTLYAVAMGVSEYSNSDWNLKYAAKDARDVLERLKSKGGDQYSEVKKLLLTDKEVTKESIAKIKDFLGGATIDDTVLMFVAGHGLLDSNYDYYFGTTDIDFNNPSDKGIAFEEFDDILAGLPCLKKSLLVDTCHAGELDQDEKALLASADSGGSAALPTGKGIAMRSIGTRGMNVKAIEGARGASEWYDRLQGLFVDLRRGSGSTILSSSAGAEYALESSEQQNGLFTYAVLEALDGTKEADMDKDGSIEMSELGEYVKKRVSELTNNKQTPNTRRVNLEGDFTLAKTK